MQNIAKISKLIGIIVISATFTVLALDGCSDLEKIQKTSEIMGKASSLPFDSVKWKGDKKIRDQMCGNLSLTLKGMPAAKVQEMLGTPDSTSTGNASTAEGQTFTWDMQNSEGKTSMYLNILIKDGVVDKTEMALAK
ncbi:MAG: hypothetical protein KIT34_03010 [Cyanobacteria bacterium TGS_CYA1]|nr:hypothetical protein [Cyanobacteria bacterium TGS_CYA1]